MFPLLLPYFEVIDGDANAIASHKHITCTLHNNDLIRVELSLTTKRHFFMSCIDQAADNLCANFTFSDQSRNPTIIEVGISLALEQDEYLDYYPLYQNAKWNQSHALITACFAPHDWQLHIKELIYDNINT